MSDEAVNQETKSSKNEVNNKWLQKSSHLYHVQWYLTPELLIN